MLAHYCITIREQPTLEFATWFEGLRVSTKENGDTMLEIEVSDQAELVSVLTRLHHLNLTLLSFACLDEADDV
jgi:hypothetical protein